MHTSWETRDALAQLGGFKRVLNYMKRVDEAEVSPPGRARPGQVWPRAALQTARAAPQPARTRT